MAADSQQPIDTPGTSGELGRRQVRQVYLLTYSQADLSMVPTRMAFSEKVLESFRNAHVGVRQWACSIEEHQDEGHHFHMAVKLDGLHRWVAVKNYLSTHFGIVCHFSSLHSSYYTAWKYVTKDDKQYIESEGHPNLVNPVDGRQARAARSTGSYSPAFDEPEAKKRKKKLSAYDVSQIILAEGIRTRVELLAFANTQKAEGKTDLAEFIVNRGAKCVAETIEVNVITRLHFHCEG